MMNSFIICIVTCSKYYSRLVDLLGSGNILYHDIKIFSEEPEICDYKYDRSVALRWYSGLSEIKSGLLENYFRSNNLNPSAYLDKSDHPSWMEPRILTNGDLSVIHKHKRALKSLLFADEDYVVVLEDDAILEPEFLNSLQSICNQLTFDYLDFAGGDNLQCNPNHVQSINGFEFEHKTLRSTRTACGYVCSRRAALAIVQELEKPYMPIDWSISVALNRISTDCQVYWLKSTIASHGSCVGRYQSWRIES